MLAGMLLEIGLPEQALAEYGKSLKTDPNRFNGLYGAAQAAEARMIQKRRSSITRNC